MYHYWLGKKAEIYALIIFCSKAAQFSLHNHLLHGLKQYVFDSFTTKEKKQRNK